MPPAATASPQAPAKFIDPKALMTIRNLELRARAVVEGFWSGLHRSPYHGFSVEFTEYREYTPGDDPRYLDWRVYARSDRFVIKKFEDETNLRCHLVVDQSRSMSYGTVGFTKAQYAATLAATMAYFLHQQGDAVGLMTFDERVREYLPARNRLGHLRHLMLSLEKPAEGRATDLVSPIERIATLVHRRGLVVLISDFLAPLDRLEKSLLTLTAAGQEVAVFQVLDPSELTFNFTQPAMFRDVETGRDLVIDPATVRKDYIERVEAHLAAVSAACAKLGIICHRLVCDRPLELALFDFLQERIRRGRQVRRGNRAMAGGRG